MTLAVASLGARLALAISWAPNVEGLSVPTAPREAGTIRSEGDTGPCYKPHSRNHTYQNLTHSVAAQFSVV